MLKESRIPNENGEFLLDVSPMSGVYAGSVTIYDITRYFDAPNGISRKRYLDRVKHTIRGNKFTVLIIDHYDCLTPEEARILAKKWYLGELQHHDYRG